jgi:hypothetical protein
MADLQLGAPRVYRVSVTFLSAGDAYAAEDYEFLAADSFDAERIARDLAKRSPYHDDRVPCLSLAVAVEPDDPDDDPAAPATALVPTCPRCGSDDLVKDACAGWDAASGSWSLAGTYDSETCLTCSREGDHIAAWVEPGSIADADRYLWSVAALLMRDDVVLQAAFQEFCLNSFDRISAEEAAEDWRARTAHRA